MNKQHLSVTVLLLAAIITAGYFYFHKPIIGRIDDPNNTPVWECPGCPKGSSVAYIDRRDPKQTVYYYDGHADGFISTVQVNDFHPTGGDNGHGMLNGYYDQRVEVEEDADEADKWNASSKAGNWDDGRHWIARDSDEARKLQKQYGRSTRRLSQTPSES